MNITQKLLEIKPTNSTRFVLPMLGTSTLKDQFFINSFYKNTYIEDQNKPEYKSNILVMYKFAPVKEFIRFEKAIELLETYTDSYDNDDDHVVTYVFEVPERYQQDYNMFINGDYINFSDNYKRQILSFWGLKTNNIITDILYGSTDIGRNWPFKMEQEIYK